MFLPASEKPAKAILICPGGGYDHLAMKDEGYDWALYFNKRSIAAVVLKYRMPNGNPEVPVSDAYEAMRYIKEHAKGVEYSSRQCRDNGIISWWTFGFYCCYSCSC